MDRHSAPGEAHDGHPPAGGNSLFFKPVQRAVRVGNHGAAGERSRPPRRRHKVVGAGSEPARTKAVDRQRGIALRGEEVGPMLRNVSPQPAACVQQDDRGERSLTGRFPEYAADRDVTAGDRRIGSLECHRPGIGRKCGSKTCSQHCRSKYRTHRPAFRGHTGTVMPSRLAEAALRLRIGFYAQCGPSMRNQNGHPGQLTIRLGR